MLLSVKRLLKRLDLWLGYVTSWTMHAFLYVLIWMFAYLPYVYFFKSVFEGQYSFNEIDTLELSVFILLIVVNIRFSWRCEKEGLSNNKERWRLTSSGVTVLTLASFCIFAVTNIKKNGISFGVSDLNENSDLYFFSFYSVYILALYAFAPLPKLGWFSKKKEPSKMTEVTGDEIPDENLKGTLEASQQANIFTDSTENTDTDSTNEENKQ